MLNIESDFGMKFYGHKGLDRFLYKNYFLNKKSGLAIEAGAMDGISLSNCKILEEIGWKCINIEPNFNLFSKLVVNRPKSINLNVALSDKIGMSKFDRERKGKNGHLVGKDGILPRLKRISKRGREMEVKTITYKKMIEDLKIEKVDLFVLDVEGWETKVIEGMKDCSVLPDFFCVEALPSFNNAVCYKDLIDIVFNKIYIKHKSCWYNDVYIKKEIL